MQACWRKPFHMSYTSLPIENQDFCASVCVWIGCWMLRTVCRIRCTHTYWIFPGQWVIAQQVPVVAFSAEIHLLLPCRISATGKKWYFKSNFWHLSWWNVFIACTHGSGLVSCVCATVLNQCITETACKYRSFFIRTVFTVAGFSRISKVGGVKNTVGWRYHHP